MTALTILRQAYTLLGNETGAATADGDEIGLTAVNQIYGELWKREHDTPFEPLDGLRRKVMLSAGYLPAMAYGTAMLLCLNGAEDRPYARYQALYEKAAACAGNQIRRRRDLFCCGE